MRWLLEQTTAVMEVALALVVKRGLLRLRAQNDGQPRESKERGAVTAEALEKQRPEMANSPPVLVRGYVAALSRKRVDDDAGGTARYAVRDVVSGVTRGQR